MRRMFSLGASLVAAAHLVLFLALPLSAAYAQDQARLDVIRSLGVVTCGLPEHMPGFAIVRSPTDADGFDVDFCRALAAAIFGAADRARFVAVATATQFRQSPDIDVVFHQLTWTFDRELTSGLSFGPVTFYDGQAFLVRAEAGFSTLADLDGGSICVDSQSLSAAQLDDYLRQTHRSVIMRLSDDRNATEAAFFAGRCDALSADASLLVSIASDHDPKKFALLPERISKEPLAPVVRAQDATLLAVLRWTIYAMMDAEELGITSSNVDDSGSLSTPLPASTVLGLSPDWARNVVKEVGNYGEVYARHFERPDTVQFARGLNALWNAGGILFAPPLR